MVGGWTEVKSGQEWGRGEAMYGLTNFGRLKQYICIIYCAVGKGELVEDITRFNPLS